MKHSIQNAEPKTTWNLGLRCSCHGDLCRLEHAGGVGLQLFVPVEACDDAEAEEKQ